MKDVIIYDRTKENWLLLRNFYDECPHWKKVRVELVNKKLIVTTYRKHKLIMIIPKHTYKEILESFLY